MSKRFAKTPALRRSSSFLQIRCGNFQNSIFRPWPTCSTSCAFKFKELRALCSSKLHLWHPLLFMPIHYIEYSSIWWPFFMVKADWLWQFYCYIFTLTFLLLHFYIPDIFQCYEWWEHCKWWQRPWSKIWGCTEQVGLRGRPQNPKQFRFQNPK